MLFYLHRIKLCLLFCIWASIFCPRQSNAQSLSAQQSLLKIKAVSDSLNRNFAPEKIYLQTDRTDYTPGDTIWYKAWVINAPSFLLSAKSGLLHVDIATDSNKVIQQFLLPISNGVTWGNITLSNDYKPGTYIIRAYTNWMRNFISDNFFYKRITISNGINSRWLIKTNTNLGVNDGKTVINAGIRFSNIDKSPVMLQAMKVQVMNGARLISRHTVQTDLNGEFKINFTAPVKNNGLKLVAQSDTKDQRTIIPLEVTTAEETDVQFLPEGGSLVAGLPARLGFKAIGTDGRGVAVSGIITDSKGLQVAAFKSGYKGMGNVSFAVKQAENYSAKVSLPGGLTKTYALPAVKASGTILQVNNDYGRDSVEVIITATADITRLNSSYFLIAKARGVFCYAGIINLKNDKIIRRYITKNLFPSGITRFTLMAANGQALNERAVYINRQDNLNIDITTSKAVYAPKDSISMQLLVTDNTGKPVRGNFALAVTDDALVKTDTLYNDNIITRLLLTSDVKGYVEEPGYYFKKSAAAWQALDDLLLTQAWVEYTRPQNNNPGVLFKPETDYAVAGTVTNLFNKPVKKSKVVLFSNRPLVVKDTLTGNNGKFSFKLPVIDSPAYILKAVNKSGGSFNVGVGIDEVAAPGFTGPLSPVIMPWYVNSNDTLLNFVKNDIAIKKQKDNLPQGVRVLNEVKISAKKIVKDSQNWNGAGNADLVFDEKDLEKVGKKSMLQFLEENVKGFRQGFYNIACCVPFVPKTVTEFEKKIIGSDSGSPWYFVGQKVAIVRFDGIEMSDFTPYFAFADYRYLLTSHSAEEIKGIEVSYSSAYNSGYLRRWHDLPMEEASYHDYAFIEITTRSGQGPVLSSTPGVYLYKPLPLSLPKQFYKPRYNVNDTTIAAYGPTINWEPNIITDANGRAVVHFNTAAKPATYTIITQGMDFNGNIGYGHFKINVQ
jgi:hypothetical protein